jgi:transposase
LKEALNAMNKLFVGLDVSQNDYKACILDGDGERVCADFALKNSASDSPKLVSAIVSAFPRSGTGKAFIGYESTSVYGWHLRHFLADSRELRPFQPSIICFNPKIIERFKGTLGDLPKNDRVDAFAIAERLRFGRLPESVPVDFRYLALQRLTRHRFHIVGNIVREKCYYLSNLFLKFSGLCQDKVFADNFGAAACAVVDEFGSLDAISEMPVGDLADFIAEKGRERFDDAGVIAEKLRAAVKSSYRLHPSMDNSLSIVLRSCLENIRALEKQKKAVERAIKAEVPFFGDECLCLKSVKGIGDVISAGLMSEIAGISRFENDNALAKFAGLYWNERQSADFTADETRLRKRGNKYLRYYFVQAADQLRKYLPEYAEYYSRKFKESKTHHHKRALVLTARKAVRLVFALLHERKLYNPAQGRGVTPGA